MTVDSLLKLGHVSLGLHCTRSTSVDVQMRLKRISWTKRQRKQNKQKTVMYFCKCSLIWKHLAYCILLLFHIHNLFYKFMHQMEIVANPQLTRVDISQDSLVQGCGQSLNFIFAMICTFFHPTCLSRVQNSILVCSDDLFKTLGSELSSKTCRNFLGQRGEEAKTERCKVAQLRGQRRLKRQTVTESEGASCAPGVGPCVVCEG